MLTIFLSVLRTVNILFCSVSCSEANQKKAPGNKVPVVSPHPGKNGTPTFAAVAAGYDKSPGKYGTSLWIGGMSLLVCAF